MTHPYCGPPNPHTVRFGHLAALCFALGRYRCTSMLIHPRTGETVLWVPFAHRPRARLGIGAVEAGGGRWLFSWGGHEWNAADDVNGTAARIAGIVTNR